MNSQLPIEGPASADLAHMLRGVERTLNWQGVQAQGPGDRAPSAVASGTCTPGVNCPTNIGAHPPPSSTLIIVAVVAFGLGFVVGRLTKRRDKSKTMSGPGR